MRIRTRRSLRWIAGIATAILLVLGVVAWAAGFFSRDPFRFFAPAGEARPIAALYFSGDMGLRFGMGPYTSKVLAEHGIGVLGFSSPTVFATHRTRADVDAAVADAVRQALARSGRDRLVLIGQSYGADILQTGLANLPADLRAHVAAVILVVPGETVYFRADPSNIAYQGTPDSLAPGTANTLDWARVTCIYGARETDSLCPRLTLAEATLIRMPGGHFLDRDSAGLADHVVAAIRRAAPDAFRTKG